MSYRQLLTNKNLKGTYKSNENVVYTYYDYMHNLYVWYIQFVASGLILLLDQYAFIK